MRKLSTYIDANEPKIYKALLNQSDTDPPTAIELVNTLGEVSFSYLDVGRYSINLNNAFPEEKTFFNNKLCAIKVVGSFYGLMTLNGSSIKIVSVEEDAYANNFLICAPIEILVYP